MSFICKPFCTAEITFSTLETMKDKLLSLPVKNVLLMMGQASANRWQLHNFLEEMSRQYAFTLLQTDVANPDQKDVCEVLSQIGDREIDVIIALGGGSVIDLAKAVSAFYDKSRNSHYTIDEITEMIRNKTYQAKQDYIDIIAIPTTAGTGSEVTQWATIWDCGKTSKFSIDTPRLKPVQAMIVPDLTMTLPKKLILSSALDAVAHAMEAFWSRHTNLLVKDLSLQSIRLITVNLKKALQNPKDRDLRVKLCRGSLLAGLSFSQTRTTACHSISYPLSFLHQVPHGFAAAITLPQVAEINRPVTENYDELEAVFAPFGGIQEWMDFVAQGVQDLQLRAFGITQQDIPTIVQYAFTAGRMDNNPRELTDEDVQLILKNIW